MQDYIKQYGYIDSGSKLIVMCAAPFDLTNHANTATTNSGSDQYGNSIATKYIKAGDEIRIGYDYDVMLSLIWKFPDIAKQFSQQQLSDPQFLLSPATEHQKALDFLERL
jgi:hypothetical protein